MRFCAARSRASAVKRAVLLVVVLTGLLAGTAEGATPATLNQYRLASSKVTKPFQCVPQGCSSSWMRLRGIDDRTSILTLRTAAWFRTRPTRSQRAQIVSAIHHDLLRRGGNGVLILGPRTTWRENNRVQVSEVAWRIQRQ
jgi:hypothetical protein